MFAYFAVGWKRSPRTDVRTNRFERYAPGYYALFFYDPDGIKLELVHRPSERDLAEEVRRLAARLERLERERG